MSDDKCKPCPFCGNKAHTMGGGDDWWINCSDRKKCMVSTSCYDTEDQAIAAWNMRAGENRLEQEKADLVEWLGYKVGAYMHLKPKNGPMQRLKEIGEEVEAIRKVLPVGMGGEVEI